MSSNRYKTLLSKYNKLKETYKSEVHVNDIMEKDFEAHIDQLYDDNISLREENERLRKRVAQLYREIAMCEKDVIRLQKIVDSQTANLVSGLRTKKRRISRRKIV